MRVIVFFDLPTETSAQRHEYGVFRRFLLRSGFFMVQKSVYSKLALNTTAAEAIMKNVREHSPPEGIVQMLTITEKQFSRIEYVVGEKSGDVLDTTDRLVIL
ncbi:MAG: CRISPR-associated endonuclease Cas2 [Oscillospiraceae bacterium]|nr:CRISPR-associated endonuclease Cas2 [Oscillospiraceae bacterium]